MTDIDPVTVGDGDSVGDECPHCEALRTTEANACAHCVDPDSTGRGDHGTYRNDADDTTGSGREAHVDAVRWYHGQIDRPIGDHTDAGEHPDRPETAREYWHERGYTDETIDRALLGWAPPAGRDGPGTAVLDHLIERGHTRDAIRASGLFDERYDGSLRPLWSGRYVFAYLDTDGRPAFAISRSTNPSGEAPHPDDGKGNKYDKPPVSWDAVTVREPIYGTDSVRDGKPVLITEGIADAVAAHQAGYPCISPVTTSFKHDDRERLLDVFDEHNVPRAYVVQDAEPPSSDLDENGQLTLTQFGEGVRGGVTTAAYLAENGDVDARVGELPQPGLDKVDLDDYLLGWAGDDRLAPILASAKPAHEHPAFDSIPRHRWGGTGAGDGTTTDAGASTRTGTGTGTGTGAGEGTGGRREYDGESDSALFDLSISDVTGLSDGYRGTNPLGHHGESEQYFVVHDDGDEAYDHKFKATYTALTYLLCEANERPPSDPAGKLSDAEIYAAWKHARQENYLPADDTAPFRAVRGAGVAHDLLDPDGFVHRDDETGRRVDDPSTHDGDIYRGFPYGVYGDALAAIADDGLDHEREHIDDGGSSDGEGNGGDGGAGEGSSGRYGIEACAPPLYETVSVDREQQWADLCGPRIDDWLDRPAAELEIWGDPPGDGKTTSAALGLAGRGESHTLLLPQHENCYEFTHDDAKPDGYYHLKGRDQPRKDCCVEAKVEADEGELPICEKHGEPKYWPRMCSPGGAGGNDDGDSVRTAFEAIEQQLGSQRAHEIVDPHDGERCAWQRAYDELERADRVVTVHNYLTQTTVQSVGKMIVDDLQQPPIAEDTVRIPGLLTAANRMDSIGRISGTPAMLGEFARFARDVVDLMTDGYEDARGDGDVTDLTTWEDEGRDDDGGSGDGDGGDTDIGIADLEPPSIPAEELPELREYWGTNFQHSELTGTVRGEPIARAKLAYNETVINRMQDGRWEPGDEPLCFDAVIALAIEAGLDSGPAYRAIAAPTEIDSCPICAAGLGERGGKRVCDDCGWDEESGMLVHPDDEKACAQARIVPAGEGDGGGNDSDGDGARTIEYRTLPLPSDLPAPADTLALDATPTPEATGALFGCDPADVVVTGDEPRALNATVTQVSNGQYHRSTIGRDDAGGERLREKHQRWIDSRSETCEQFLVVSHKHNREFYDLPENADWMHFHAARGLDRSAYDGAIVIGSPHPNMEGVQRDAGLLAMHRADTGVGGDEHSTRRDAPNPPVYRKLLYEDEDGDGRAVPTKHYTGLTGALFRAGREDEIEQVGHRVRPGQADPDDEKFIDLLTNVPTDLPVDQFVTLEELTEPFATMLPVTDGAVRLLGYVRDVMVGDGPDGFRARELVDIRSHGVGEADAPKADIDDDADTEVANKAAGYHRLAGLCGEDATIQTIYRWLHQLEGIGLLTPEAYEHRRGVSYAVDIATLTSALTVISHNADVKVAAKRALAAQARESADGLDWLTWAEALFDLSGDRATWDTTDPPPGRPAGPAD